MIVNKVRRIISNNLKLAVKKEDNNTGLTISLEFNGSTVGPELYVSARRGGGDSIILEAALKGDKGA
jgi:hypothetical protein